MLSEKHDSPNFQRSQPLADIPETDFKAQWKAHEAERKAHEAERQAEVNRLAAKVQESTGVSFTEARFRIQSALESAEDFDQALANVRAAIEQPAETLSITARELGVKLKPGEAYAYSMEPDGANGKPILHIKERSSGKVVTPRQKHASGYAKNRWGGTDCFSGPNRRERRAARKAQ